MKRVVLLLCEGVEIFEAGAFHDVLGWASEYGSEKIDVVSVGLNSEVRCTFGLTLVPDCLLGEIRAEEFDALAIPGGFGEYGYYESGCSNEVADLVKAFHSLDRPIASICVGALPVASSGILEGRRATTYHLLGGERRRQLADYGAEVVDQPMVKDGDVITSTGPGTAAEVAFTLLEDLTDADNVERIRHLMGFDG